MKTIEKEILHVSIESKHNVVNDRINQIKKESFKNGQYEGMSETLDYLGINPAQWSDIKQGKLKVKLLKK